MTATEAYNTGILRDVVTIRLKGTIAFFIPLRRHGSSIIWVVQLVLINRLTSSCGLDHPGGSAGLGLGSRSYMSNCSRSCLGLGSRSRDRNGMGGGCKVRRGRGGWCRSSSSRGSLCLGRSRGTCRSVSTVRPGYQYVDNRNNHQQQGQQCYQCNYQGTTTFLSRSS